ncbi:hypothetical protein WJX81_003638 [Elliptochloris bilobata]|uniref:Uncharacterized protein n=1 Tax=Elliptochloris bilobata TaxID=381761 RepID=A0AAW1RHX2_9CHLO
MRHHAGRCLGAGKQSPRAATRRASAKGGQRMAATSAPEWPSTLPPLESIRGVLFDIDGTLCDSEHLHYDVYREILLEKGYRGYRNGEPISQEFFDEQIAGGHISVLGRKLWPDWPQEDRDAFCEEKEARFRKLASSSLKPVEGLADFLAWVDSRKLRKAAVTNALRANSVAMLNALGLGDTFEVVVLGEDCARPKPHPDPYLKALEVLGLQPHEAIVIEDSPSGAAAGVAAGLPVVGILTSQTAEHMKRAGAVRCVKDYRELLALAQNAPSPAMQAA